jgi:predicted dehydrogenase
VLAAVSTMDRARADEFLAIAGTDTPVFESIEALAASSTCDVTIVATNTELHREHTLRMIGCGHRVFLEKPLTGTLQGDREFTAELERGYPDAVMLGFQRRFDEPLLHAKRLMDAGAIGRVFKICSALEDSGPAPDGFSSPGIVPDMGIHNVDEILWLSGRLPQSALAIGSRLFSHRLTTCREDFDDALLFLDFGDELIAQVEVSRNHVAGYRGETVLYGEEGEIHVGRFYQRPTEVIVEAYRRGGRAPMDSKTFQTRRYNQALPEFIDRFGDAYKQELKMFLVCCRDASPFPITHRDALRAQEVVSGAMKGLVRKSDMCDIDYEPIS